LVRSSVEEAILARLPPRLKIRTREEEWLGRIDDKAPAREMGIATLK